MQMACQSQSKRMMTRTFRRLYRSTPLPLAFVDVAFWPTLKALKQPVVDC